MIIRSNLLSLTKQIYSVFLGGSWVSLKNKLEGWSILRNYRTPWKLHLVCTLCELLGSWKRIIEKKKNIWEITRTKYSIWWAGHCKIKICLFSNSNEWSHQSLVVNRFQMCLWKSDYISFNQLRFFDQKWQKLMDSG